MHPMTDVLFTWTNATGKKEELTTKFAYAREIATHLLELTQIDKISDVYYTVNNDTFKLDYYNTEL